MRKRLTLSPETTFALYAALKDLVKRCDGEEGVTADGSNVQTIQAHAALAEVEGRTDQSKTPQPSDPRLIANATFVKERK